MTMADKIAANARPHLDEGEQVQGAFAGQHTVTVGSQTMKVNRRYLEQLRAIDAALPV